MTSAPSFILPVDKPPGPTSHDVVAVARRALGVRRIGHTGTLDPFASGLLLLCVGHATRIVEYLTGLPKTYEAAARLDGRTLTDDSTSALLDVSDNWRTLTAAEVETALSGLAGEIMQMPPQYSAKKVAGERAYDIARRGDVATLTPVAVQIYRIEVRAINLPDVEFMVECSAGTYIRAIARDLGAALGTGGYLTALRRTRVGRHDVDNALPLEQLQDAARVEAAALTPAEALSHLPAVQLTDDTVRAIRFGQSIEGNIESDGPVQLLMDGKLVAIAQGRDGRLWPVKVFSDV